MKVDFEKEKVKEYKYQVHQEVMVVDGVRYRRTYSTYDDREGWSVFDAKKRKATLYTKINRKFTFIHSDSIGTDTIHSIGFFVFYNKILYVRNRH